MWEAAEDQDVERESVSAPVAVPSSEMALLAFVGRGAQVLAFGSSGPSEMALSSGEVGGLSCCISDHGVLGVFSAIPATVPTEVWSHLAVVGVDSSPERSLPFGRDRGILS